MWGSTEPTTSKSSEVHDHSAALAKRLARGGVTIFLGILFQCFFCFIKARHGCQSLSGVMGRRSETIPETTEDTPTRQDDPVEKPAPPSGRQASHCLQLAWVGTVEYGAHACNDNVHHSHTVY